MATAYLLAFSVTVFAEPARGYRAAVLPSGKSGYDTEFDFALKAAGIAWTHATNSVESMDGLVEHLDDYRLLLAPTLFMWGEVRYDMKKYVPKIRKWVENGGCILIVDANYPASLDWIKVIDPSLEIGSEHCGGLGPAVATEPRDPMLFFPGTCRYGFTWGHMTVPKKSSWRVAATCGHGKPTMTTACLGRGLVVLTVLRGSSYCELIRNIRGNAEFLAIGLAIQSSRIPDLLPGTNSFSISCRNWADKPVQATLELRVTPLKKQEEGPSLAVGETQTWTSLGRFEPHASTTVKLNCLNPVRGLAHVQIVLKADSSEGVCFDREVVLPSLFAVQGNRYRGVLTSSRRFTEVEFGFRVQPVDEKLDTYTVNLSVADSKSQQVATKTVAAAVGQSWIPIPFRRNLAAGVYSIRGELRDGTKSVAADTATVEVLQSVPGESVFDEDNALLVDGKPFFTLGLYHASPKHFSEIADLGFNLMQVCGWWQGWGTLDPLQWNGMKLLWESGLDERGAADLSTHPAMMLHYTQDEPEEAHFDRVRDVDTFWRAKDAHHPTFMVSYQPTSFHKNVELGDILAPDPYPYNVNSGEDSYLARVGEWMDLAREASNGQRPVFCVPQSFGKEPPQIWRCMAFLAVTHGAKGLIWYPWDESFGCKDQGSGMRFNKELKEAARQLLLEFRALSLALLNGKDDSIRFFAERDYTLHGMVCRDPSTCTRYLLLANSTKHPLSMALKLPELDPAITQVEGAVRDKAAKAEQGTLQVELEPFGTRIYCWGGPKPVLDAPSTEFVARKLPFRASGKTIKVGPGKTFTDIQSAVDASSDGDVLRIAPGTYAPFVSNNKLLDIVAEGDAATTIVDGAGKARCATLSLKPFGDMSFQTNTLLRGFTLRSGNSTTAKIRPELGGAVFGGTLEYCVVEKSVSDYGAGAAYVNLFNTTLRKNSALKNGGAATLCSLVNCTVTANTAVWDGGGLSFCKTKNCVVSGNASGRDGGGVQWGETELSTVKDNRAGRHGGGLSGLGTVTDTLVENNKAKGDGGGVYNGRVRNCTIVRNSAGNFGGGTGDAGLPQFSLPAFTAASIIWGNEAKGDENTRSFANVIPKEESFAQWTNAVPGQISTNDPGFADFNRGDYRLKTDSPCTDRSKRKVSKATKGALDYQRMRGPSVDIGAFETVAKPVESITYEWSLRNAADLRNAALPLVPAGRKEPMEKADGSGVLFDGAYGLRTGRRVDLLGRDTLVRATVLVRFKCEFGTGGTLFACGVGNPFVLAVEPATGRLFGSLVMARSKEPKDWKRNTKATAAGIGVADGKWHTTEFTVDRSAVGAEITCLFLDGKELPPVAGEEAEGWFVPGASQAVIGMDADGTGGFFKGEITDARLKLEW